VTTEWPVLLAYWAPTVVVAGGGLISWGVTQQRVKDLMKRADETEARLDVLENVGQKLELMDQSTKNAHATLLAELRHAQEMSGQSMEGLRSEVRAFMQGQASGRRQRGANGTAST
jgi:hypothetical protein